MARILGFNITRNRPDLRLSGTEYEARTVQNVVRAGAGSSIPDGQRFANLPPMRRTEPQNRGAYDELGGRVVTNDPRETYWGALPNKIQPKQAMWMVRAAMGGDLWQFWRLTENMLNTWPKFAMAQHQLREATSYVKFACHPAQIEGLPATDQAIERRNLVQDALASMRPDPFNDEKGRSGMIYNFTDGVVRGVELEELIWKDPERTRQGWRRLPKSSAWTHPRHFTFGQNGSLVVFSSASSLNIGDYRRYGKAIGEKPNADKMICSQFMSRSGSSVVNGFAIQAVWWWCARQYGLDFVLKMAQNFGNPTVDATYKPGMSQAEKNQLLAELIKGMGNRVLMHQEGTTLNIEPAQNLGTDNPQRWIIEESDREILYLFLGQTGSTISAAGKLGDESTHQDVKMERVSGLAKWVAQGPLEQYARAVLRVNYGNDDDCPTFEPDFTKPLTSDQVAQLSTAITNSSLPVKAEEHYQKLGYTVPKPGDEVFQAGAIKIMGEPLTDEERQEQELEQQSKLAEVQGQPAQARGTDLQTLFRKAADSDLDEVERLVRAVEQAPHPNGEVKALAAKITSMNRR